MAIAGLRGLATANWETDERPKNFREMILWRDPNGMAPLTALMSKMGSESTDDPEFAWYEEELKPARLKVSAISTTNQTTITLDTSETGFDALDMVAGDLLLVEKLETTSYGFEIVEVSTNPSASNTITVTRGASGTTANTANINTNTYLLKIGSAFEEGSGAPKASSRKPSKFYNYTQIFKTSYNLTNTAIGTRFRTGDPVSNDKKRKMFDHASAQEYAWLFGYRNETTGATGQPKRYTGGLYQWLATNNTVAYPTIKIWTTTNVTQEEILDALYKMFDYGYTGAGNERIGLCGNGFLNTLNKIVLADTATRINYEKEIDFFGMKLEKWRLPQGTIYLRTHPLMNVNSRFTNGAFLLNPSGLKYRYLKGRDTMFKDNVQANDEDQRKGYWMTEAGLEVHHLKSMMYVAIQP